MSEKGDIYQRRTESGGIETVLLLAPLTQEQLRFVAVELDGLDWEVLRVNQSQLSNANSWSPGRIKLADLEPSGFHRLGHAF